MTAGQPVTTRWNKTRDLEKASLDSFLRQRLFDRILEIGCGTGKNTSRLGEQCSELVAVDFSEGMMARARQKVELSNVRFIQADINETWEFADGLFDLITFSLVLEHIEKLDFVFEQAARCLRPGGSMYVCELHPYKQYQGSKASFNDGDGLMELDCFVHHASDYFNATNRIGLVCDRLDEWFDGNDRQTTPRLLSFSFRRPA